MLAAGQLGLVAYASEKDTEWQHFRGKPKKSLCKKECIFNYQVLMRDRQKIDFGIKLEIMVTFYFSIKPVANGKVDSVQEVSFCVGSVYNEDHSEQAQYKRTLDWW